MLGVVISHTEGELSDANRRNLEELRRGFPVPELGELRHGRGELSPPVDLARLLAASARA